jgi:hypothetical protein
VGEGVKESTINIMEGLFKENASKTLRALKKNFKPKNYSK